MEEAAKVVLPAGITSEIVTQWVIILILGVSAFLLTRNLKKIPNKKQAAIEKIYVTIESVVASTMSERYKNFVPYIGSLMIYLLCLNFTGLIGIEPPTKDLGVTLGLGLTTFMTIHYNAIKENGLLGYMKGYAHPFFFMLPLNIMEKLILPVSLALRLFGNMLAATILIDLIYNNLPRLGLPIVAHVYFDLFDGAIQMLVFSMLTMIQIKLTAEE